MTALRRDIRAPHVETPDTAEDLVPDFKCEPDEPVDEETQASLNTLLKPVPL